MSPEKIMAQIRRERKQREEGEVPWTRVCAIDSPQLHGRLADEEDIDYGEHRPEDSDDG